MHRFTSKLLNWYRKNKRTLPWRENANPYYIWLSEVMLQQTRVDQGTDYFLRFRERYPKVTDLANASEDEVLKLWQGLGYYSRARNLHTAARQVKNDFNGQFPSSAQELIKLKGVGPYTAAAIASMAFNERIAVVDGNVLRVIARAFGVHDAINSTTGHEKIRVIMDSLIPPSVPGEFNQAVMELGALICHPHNPKCHDCPVAPHCHAFNNSEVELLPVKIKKKKSTPLHIAYIVIFRGEELIVRQRDSSGIWAKLFDFPAIEQPDPIPEDAVLSLASEFAENPCTLLRRSEAFTHLLTHRRITAHYYLFESDELTPPVQKSYSIQDIESLKTLAVSRLVDKMMKEIISIRLKA